MDESPQSWIYGSADLWGKPIFVMVPRDRAVVIATWWRVLDAPTWGVARAIAGVELTGELYESAGFEGFEEMYEEEGRDLTAAADRFQAEYGERLPADDEPFEREHIWGVSDGDFPTDPRTLHAELLPREVAGRFGLGYDTVLNGPYLELDPTRTGEIVAEMERLGHVCLEDPELAAGVLPR